jgi:ABC-type multidrug transport system fused ATPase/permease subunit
MFHIARKLIALFTTPERRRLYLILGLIVLMALVDVAGIASVMPFLSVVSDPEIVHTNDYLSTAYAYAGSTNERDFLLLLGAGVLGLLVASNVLRSVTTWLLLRFVWRRNHTLSRRLLSNYLAQPYLFFTTVNTAELSKNILTEVEEVISELLVPAMQGTAKAVVVVFILGLLIWIDPLMAVFVSLVLGGTYGAIYVIIRRRMSRSGRQRLIANQERFKIAAEAFGGIKDLKILGKEATAVEKYSRSSLRYVDAHADRLIFSQLPRNILEVIAFGGIMVILLVLLATRDNLNNVIPLVGLYAFAGYRLMPSLQTIFATFTKVRYNREALDALHHELSGFSDTAPPVLTAANETLELREALEVRDLQFQYPSSSELTLRSVSLKIEAHSSVGLIGATGSGKTTLLNLLLGLFQPKQGELLLDGVRLSPSNIGRWQNALGFVPQEVFLADDTVASNIAFGLSENEINMATVRHAAKVAEIDCFVRGELPQGYQTMVGERGVRLSGGQRQRIGLARALYRNPSVLILDEATSALDGITEQKIMKSIDELKQDKTIIMIAHRLTTLKDCDVIYLLEEGAVVAKGSYEQLMAENEVFRQMANAS